jgi:hypothetical protein
MYADTTVAVAMGAELKSQRRTVTFVNRTTTQLDTHGLKPSEI